VVHPSDNNDTVADRRCKPRLYGPIGLTVCGVDRGERYCFETVVANISAGGICALAPRAISIGQELSFRIRFALAGSRPSSSPTVVTRGVVVRMEERPAGRSRFAAAFTCVEPFDTWS
jgi:hypothetical protein